MRKSYWFLALLILSACLTTIATGKTYRYFTHNAGKSWSVNSSSEQAFSGTSSLRLEHRPGDLVLDSKVRGERVRMTGRNEIAFYDQRSPMGSARFYSWAFYLDPLTNWENVNVVVMQLHQGDQGDGKGQGPILSHFIGGGNYNIAWHEPRDGFTLMVGHKSLNIEPGKWYRATYEVKYSTKKDGYVRLWLNGDLVIDYQGPFGARGGRHFLKLGMYNQSQTWPQQETEIMYLDDMFLGNGLAPDELKSAFTSATLARSIQAELSRLGCNPGPIDGVWGGKTQNALDTFFQSANLDGAVAVGSELVSILQSHTGRTCPEGKATNAD